MSASSISDVEKDVGLREKTSTPHLSQEQEDLVESAEPPFTVHEDDDPQPTTLQKSVSRISVNNVNAVPDGGLTAWLQVVASFFLFFNTWGIVNTFGTYQTYYETGILSSSTPSAISWIGSIQAFLLMLVGALTGPIYDAGYVHTLLLTGSVLVVLGQMMLSLCTTYWQVMLSQAICIGLGCGCLFVPGVAILSTYFRKRIATAMGLAAAGSSLGGVIYPIVFYRLEPSLGFPWATRIIGFIALAGLLVSNLVFKVRVLPASRRRFLDLKAFTELPYLFFVLGTFLSFTGLYVFFFYAQTYALQRHLADESMAFYLLAIINAGSVFGRIIPNYFADRTGPLNMILPCSYMAAILTLCLIAVRSLAPLIVVAALYGFFTGTFVSLPPTIFVSLSPDRGLIGTRMGMGFSVVSIGMLIGTPVSGAVLAAGGFTATWLFGGLFMIVGAGVITMARVSKTGLKLMVKA